MLTLSFHNHIFNGGSEGEKTKYPAGLEGIIFVQWAKLHEVKCGCLLFVQVDKNT